MVMDTPFNGSRMRRRAMSPRQRMVNGVSDSLRKLGFDMEDDNLLNFEQKINQGDADVDMEETCTDTSSYGEYPNWTPYTSSTSSSYSTVASRNNAYLDSSVNISSLDLSHNSIPPVPRFSDSPFQNIYESEGNVKFDNARLNLSQSFMSPEKLDKENISPRRFSNSRSPESASMGSIKSIKNLDSPSLLSTKKYRYENRANPPLSSTQFRKFNQNERERGINIPRPVPNPDAFVDTAKLRVKDSSTDDVNYPSLTEDNLKPTSPSPLHRLATPPAIPHAHISCPVTPARTPAWRNNLNSPTPLPLGPTRNLIDYEGAHTNERRHGKLQRQNSLCLTKMLVTLEDENCNKTKRKFHEQRPFYDDFSEIRLLGSGSFSDVYLVECKSTGKLFAMKKSKNQFKSKNDRKLYLQEVEMYRQITPCKYIVRYYSCFQEEGYFCQILEYCEHGTLETAIRRIPENDSMPEGDVWKCAHDIASALDHMHRHNIVHMDVKPDNVFLSAEGLLKLGDLGLACLAGTVTDGNEGDTMYVAFELLRNAPSHPSADMFSFGLLLLRIILNKPLPIGGVAWHDLREGRIPHAGDFDQLIKSLLCENPVNRISAKEVLSVVKINQTN